MATYVSSKSLPTNIAADVRYTVLAPDGAVLVARTNAGVMRVFDGVDYGLFQVLVTVPDGTEHFTVVWDDNAGNAIMDVFNVVAMAASVDVEAIAQAVVEEIFGADGVSLENFQVWASSNPDGKTIHDMTTPKNSEVSIS